MRLFNQTVLFKNSNVSSRVSDHPAAYVTSMFACRSLSPSHRRSLLKGGCTIKDKLIHHLWNACPLRLFWKQGKETKKLGMLVVKWAVSTTDMQIYLFHCLKYAQTNHLSITLFTFSQKISMGHLLPAKDKRNQDKQGIVYSSHEMNYPSRQ